MQSQSLQAPPMLNLLKKTAVIGIAALTVCSSSSIAGDLPRPWQEAGPLTGIQLDDGTTAEAARGIWRSRGYGRLLQISERGIEQYEIGDTCYAPKRDDGSFSAMDSVGYRYFQMLPDKNSAIFQLLRGDTNVVFDRLPTMPEPCLADTVASPSTVSEAFLDAFQRHYAFFDRRLPNHAERAARVRAAIRSDMSDAELWDTVASYMDGLSDSHTKLIGEVDGGKRRVQDGQGETLPMVRESEGGEQAWLVGLLDQTIEKLGDTAHHVGRDRILWGMVDKNIGYLQIFQMGGFTEREDFGSDAWAEAEMAEFNRIMDDAFSAFAQAGVDSVILDLSNNRGGWDRIAKAIAGRFTEATYLGFTTVARGSGLAPFPHLIEPAAGPRFTDKVYLMTSDVTVSGGELATLALRQNPRVIHVGETTRGSFSTPLAKRLPNGWLLELSNEIFSAPDGTVYEETGLTPEIAFEVYPSSAPITGHRRAIERLVAIIMDD